MPVRRGSTAPRSPWRGRSRGRTSRQIGTSVSDTAIVASTPPTPAKTCSAGRRVSSRPAVATSPATRNRAVEAASRHGGLPRYVQASQIAATKKPKVVADRVTSAQPSRRAGPRSASARPASAAPPQTRSTASVPRIRPSVSEKLPVRTATSDSRAAATRIAAAPNQKTRARRLRVTPSRLPLPSPACARSWQ